MTSPSTSSHICGSRVVLLSIGEFNPPTYAHMRMFECARDFVHRTLHCEVLEGVMMTSSNRYPIDNYRKHRLRMVETAIRRSNWIRSSDWAASQHEHVRYSTAFKHILKEIKSKYGSSVHLIYMCGSDVISNLQKAETDRARWSQTEIADVLKENGLIVFKRGGHKPQHNIYHLDVLRNNQANIFVIEDETFPNNTSSERIRTAIRRGESVKYCIDDAVLEYIQEQKLYGQEIQDFFPDNERSSSTTSTFSSTVSSFLENKRPKSSETDVVEDYHPPPVSPRSSSIGKIGNGSSMTSSSREPSEQPSVRLNTICPRHGNRKKREPDSERRRPENEDHHEKCVLYAKIDKSRKRVEPDVVVTGTFPTQHGTTKLPEATVTPQGSPRRPAKGSLDRPRASPECHLPPNGAVQKSPLVISVKSQELNGVPMRTVGSTEGLTPLLTETDLYSILCDGVFGEEINRVPSDSPLPSMVSARPHKQLSPLPLRINSTHYNPPFSPTLESPNYDNVTLDELLASSNHWAEYMEKQAQKLNEKTEAPLDFVDIRSKINEEIKEKEGKPSKKKTATGWFFRKKSSKEKEEKRVISPTSEEERSVIRICGTDRREQPQTSPEILWRKITSEKKIKLNGLPPSPKKAICLRHPTSTVTHSTKSPEKKKNDAPKNLRFIQQLTQSAENLPSYVQEIPSPMSQSCYEGAAAQDGVTLTFRRYRLTSTPETTV